MIWYILTKRCIFSFENTVGIIAPIKKLEYHGEKIPSVCELSASVV